MLAVGAASRHRSLAKPVLIVIGGVAVLGRGGGSHVHHLSGLEFVFGEAAVLMLDLDGAVVFVHRDDLKQRAQSAAIPIADERRILRFLNHSRSSL